ARDTVVFEGVSWTRGGEPLVRFLASLDLEGRRVGTLGVALGTEDLAEVTGRPTGLENSGEVLVVTRDPTGAIRVLRPADHPLAGGRVGPAASELLVRALAGEEGPFVEGLLDHRGEPVWAATRLLPELGWGLVVKLDEDEERAPVLELRNRLAGVGFSLSAFAILLGVLLGLRIANPIQELAEVANRIRLGELDARAEGSEREDELGLLAQTFNQMGDELERRMELLQEYRRFFELSPDLLCIAGTDGFFKRVNPAFVSTLGWSEEELLGRPFAEFVHPDDVARTHRETARLAQGIPTVSFENRYRLPGGGYQRLHWTCHPDSETGLLYAVARAVPGEEGSGEEGGES
ncbi:MAG TPA: PAS domain-containing protein, partial [Longimicrobiales bacterium]|nr:PAS domain-containing protein [Longimicrobiales bacterium]